MADGTTIGAHTRDEDALGFLGGAGGSGGSAAASGGGSGLGGGRLPLTPGPSIAIIDDQFFLTEGEAATGNLFADNGGGPDTAPVGTNAIVTRINGQGPDDDDGTFFLSNAEGLSVAVGPDGDVTFDATEALDRLAEGERATFTMTYEATVAGTLVPGQFVAEEDVTQLTSDGGIVILGAAEGDFSGIALAQGRFGVGSYLADSGGTENTGRVDLLFPEPDRPAVVQQETPFIALVDNAPGGAFGAEGNDLFGQSLALAAFDDGYVNAIGVPRDDRGGQDAGAVDVSFIPRSLNPETNVSTETVEFSILGANERDYAGLAVDVAEAFSADEGYAIVVSSWPADPGGRFEAGTVSVVYGGLDDVDLGALSAEDGVTFAGDAAGDQFGSDVSARGDTDGDGLSDLLVGALGAETAYLISGGTTMGGTAAQVSTLTITGPAGSDLGRSVAIAEDINGDGLDDLLLGAPETAGRAGAVHVVFGDAERTGTLNASALNGTNGFTILGADPGGRAGLSVAGAGDVNNDGIADIVIGAPYEGADDAGAAYVVFGRTDGFAATVDLGALDGTDGFRLSGLGAETYFGWAVAGVGDVNGDRIDDFAASGFGYDNDRGATAVVHGRGSFAAETGSAVVTLTVEGVNDDPVAIADLGTVEVGKTVSFELSENDVDIDGGSLTVTALDTESTAGSVFFNERGGVTYVPGEIFDSLADGETATDGFGYTVSDGEGGTDQGLVTIAVVGVNAPPSAADDVATTDEDTSVVIGVTTNDTDPDDDTLSVIALDDTETSGAVFLDEGGQVVYDPGDAFDFLAPDESATDSFAYTISDGSGATDSATVTVTVSGVNDDPVATDDTAETDADTGVSLDPVANDIDPDSAPLFVSALDDEETAGNVFIDEGGGVFYSPGDAFDTLPSGTTATDSFGYSVSDGDGGTDEGTVTVTVTGTFFPFDIAAATTSGGAGPLPDSPADAPTPAISADPAEFDGQTTLNGPEVEPMVSSGLPAGVTFDSSLIAALEAVADDDLGAVSGEVSEMDPISDDNEAGFDFVGSAGAYAVAGIDASRALAPGSGFFQTSGTTGDNAVVFDFDTFNGLTEGSFEQMLAALLDDNTLEGSGSRDLMVGGDGNDRLMGGDGGDLLVGDSDIDLYLVRGHLSRLGDDDVAPIGVGSSEGSSPAEAIGTDGRGSGGLPKTEADVDSGPYTQPVEPIAVVVDTGPRTVGSFDYDIPNVVGRDTGVVDTDDFIF